MQLSGWHWAGLTGGGIAALWAAWRLVKSPAGEGVTDDDPTQPESPSQLALDAGATLPVYCLARATASEEGGEPRAFQQAVACAILNFARSEHPELADGEAVVKLVLGSAGAFGRQGTGGRRVASTRVPVSAQIALARSVLAGGLADPTDGATQFDSPSGQRAALERDPLTTKTPEQIADERMRHGYELVTVPGIDPDRLRFWRKA